MNILNIGLDAKGRRLPVERVLDTLNSVGGARTVRFEIHENDTEPTLVVQTTRPLYAAAIYAVAQALNQDAIAQHEPYHGGAMYGPNATAWGRFDPDQFIVLGGHRLSETVSSPANA